MELAATRSTARTRPFLEERPVTASYDYLPPASAFQLCSTTVQDGQRLPVAQMSGIKGVPGGRDRSPQLSWNGHPPGTRSFVVSMYDPQAYTGSGFWHWVVADLPATTTSLAEGAGALGSHDLPTGVFQLGGDAGTPQFFGAAPPPGSGVHEYRITVTAIDVDRCGVDTTASAGLLGFTIAPHTLARAVIVCPTPSPA